MIFISISIKRNILNYIHATFTSKRLKPFLRVDSQMKQNVTLIFFEYVAKIYWPPTQPPTKNIAAGFRKQNDKLDFRESRNADSSECIWVSESILQWKKKPRCNKRHQKQRLEIQKRNYDGLKPLSELMLLCWLLQPPFRPSFHQVCKSRFGIYITLYYLLSIQFRSLNVV